MFGELFLQMLAFLGCILLAGIILGVILIVTFILILFIKAMIQVIKGTSDSRK